MSDLFDFSIKRGDLKPRLEVIFEDARGNVVPIPSGATVDFHMRLPYSDTLTVNAAGTVDNAPAGAAAYDWAEGDTVTEGYYLAEFEMTETDGKKTTFPNHRNLIVKVFADLA